MDACPTNSQLYRSETRGNRRRKLVDRFYYAFCDQCFLLANSISAGAGDSSGWNSSMASLTSRKAVWMFSPRDSEKVARHFSFRANNRPRTSYSPVNVSALSFGVIIALGSRHSSSSSNRSGSHGPPLRGGPWKPARITSFFHTWENSRSLGLLLLRVPGVFTARGCAAHSFPIPAIRGKGRSASGWSKPSPAL